MTCDYCAEGNVAVAGWHVYGVDQASELDEPYRVPCAVNPPDVEIGGMVPGVGFLGGLTWSKELAEAMQPVADDPMEPENYGMADEPGEGLT